MEDVYFYFIRRLMHFPFFNNMFHKVHHGFTQTSALATAYTHPFEYLIANLITIILCPKILGPEMHFVRAMVHYTVISGESLDGH